MSTVDTSIFFFLHTIINSLLKNVLTKCVGQYFSKIYFFKKSLIVWHNLCPDIFSWFLFGQPLPIFVVLIFFERKQISKMPAVFYPRLNISLIPSSAKSPGWNISGRSQSWESNRGQQWLSTNGQIKNLSRFLLRTKFRFIFERKKWDLFDRTSNGASSLLEKRKYGLFDRPQQVIRKLYGFKKLTEVFTPVEFHSEEI